MGGIAMANLYDATYRQADESKLKEHDNALLDAQISLLKKVQAAGGATGTIGAVGYAEAYALISGKLSNKPAEMKKS
jgi:hypothetical protein